MKKYLSFTMPLHKAEEHEAALGICRGGVYRLISTFKESG